MVYTYKVYYIPSKTLAKLGAIKIENWHVDEFDCFFECREFTINLHAYFHFIVRQKSVWHPWWETVSSNFDFEEATTP